MVRSLSVIVGLSLLVVACASAPSKSTQSKQSLEDMLEAKVGKGTKADLTEKFGEADWCRARAGGGETCQFSRTLGEKWMGSKKHQKRRKIRDSVEAVFAPNGTLRAYKVQSQR